MEAHQAPPSLGYSRHEHGGGLPFSFSNAWKWKLKVKSLSSLWLLVTPWTAPHEAPPVHGIFQARVLEWGAIAFSYATALYENEIIAEEWWVYF